MQIPAVPMRVHGVIQASRARVFYVDDTLYVFNTKQTFASFVGNPPIKRGRGWVMDGPGGTVSFEKGGCSCSWALSGNESGFLSQIEASVV
jgi:hypothetical protein